MTSGLKEIYLAPSETAALEKFGEKRDVKYPAISKSWRSRWNEVIPHMKFSPEIRKAVYTASPVKQINNALWKTRFI